ncbi:MAG TPA: phosphate ABC transporter substrate-binding protein [Oscillospiraceae bacterium]|nr:phosphate ABC transporter substrate-binding protein [Oscillospiraceae bacterium]
MKKILLTVASLLLSAAVFVGCGGTPSSSEESNKNSSDESAISGSITLTGSTSMEKVAKALAGAFEAANDNVKVTVGGGGSGTGMTDAIDGKADVGMASRNLKDTEAAELDGTVIGIDGIAVVVNNANDVSDVTIEQLEKIYSGEIRNWSEVGGVDKPIVVIGREEGSGTRDGFESIVMKNSEVSYGQELTETGSVLSTVGTTEGAIGYASLANVDDSIKTLLIGGIAPSEATVLDGTYAIQRPFYFAVKKGNDSVLAKSFLEFVLSDAGKEQVRNAGVIPPQ